MLRPTMGRRGIPHMLPRLSSSGQFTPARLHNRDCRFSLRAEPGLRGVARSTAYPPIPRALRYRPRMTQTSGGFLRVMSAIGGNHRRPSDVAIKAAGKHEPGDAPAALHGAHHGFSADGMNLGRHLKNQCNNWQMPGAGCVPPGEQAERHACGIESAGRLAQTRANHNAVVDACDQLRKRNHPGAVHGSKPGVSGSNGPRQRLGIERH